MSDANPEAVLKDTPYVLSGERGTAERFTHVHNRCAETAEIATRAQQRIRERAGTLLDEFSSLVRSELVAESNRIEGYDWSTSTVKAATDLNKELLSLPLRAFTDAVRNDRRVFEALGIYKAHQLAEEWAEERIVPREADVRALHSLIAAGEDYAGRYKVTENKIHGSSLKTSAPWDVPRDMEGLVSWWRQSDAPPVLQATIVHSWLTQVHPFDDGNGRMARLLANMAMAQHGYPPLMLKSASDRGQYLDALAQSDEGNILPLYELFAQVTRRYVRVMARHEYVDEVIAQRLLSDLSTRIELWSKAAYKLYSALENVCASKGWSIKLDGMPDASAFHLLVNADPEGNGWFCRFGPPDNSVGFLAWWGFESREMLSARGRDVRASPSCFLSNRFGHSIHPYSRDDADPEIQLAPLTKKPAMILDRHGCREMGYEQVAVELVNFAEKLL